ncbi:MAG: GNAT family N-acetyltransferase [Candidatus Omnitrophica bacterium]|nr:GNAT family N-acetyltransferase [Candidatus Omnitrophota bacterium]
MRRNFPIQIRLLALATCFSLGIPSYSVKTPATLRQQHAGMEEIARTLHHANPADSGLEELAGVEIAETTPGQIDALLKFREDAFKEKVSWDGDFDEPLFRKRLDALIRHEIPGALVVARAGGEIVGYAASYPKPPANSTGEISELAVDLRYERKGLGSKLFAQALEGLVRFAGIATVQVQDFSTAGAVGQMAEKSGFAREDGSGYSYRLQLPPIALAPASGLPIYLERGRTHRIFGPDNEPWGDPPDLRTAGDMREVLVDPDVVGYNMNEIVEYRMYRDRALAEHRSSASEHKLRYDVTVIAPSDDAHRFGAELVKTYGHYHPPRAPEVLPEVYEVLYGEAWFLLQKPSAADSNVIGDIVLIKARAGEKAIMLPGYGHVTINPSATEPIVMANWVSSAFQSDYTQYRQHHGAAVYVSLVPDSPGQVQILRNPAYSTLPDAVRIARPIPALMEFGLEDNRPMYQLIFTAPTKLGFLNAPENFSPEFGRALIWIGPVRIGDTMPAGLEEWAQRSGDYYQGANVAVIGGTGFVGGHYLRQLHDRYGSNIASVRALTRIPARLNAAQFSDSPGAGKLALEQGDHLLAQDIQRTIGGAKLVVDTAGLAWQHLPGGVPATLTDELLQNAMSAGLIGLLLADDQRLVWTSSNAGDYMFARLTAPERNQLMQEINERAARYVDWLGQQPGLAIADETFRQFIESDLAEPDHIPAQFVPQEGKPAVSFAHEYSYPYSKLLGQQILELIARRDNRDIRVLKISDVYGPGQGLGQEYWDPSYKGGRLAARRLQRFIAVAEAIRTGQYQPWNRPNPQDGYILQNGMLHQTVFNDYAAPTHVRDVVEMIHRVAALDVEPGPERKVVFEVAAPWIPNNAMADAVINAVNDVDDPDRTIHVAVLPAKQPILRREPANASGDLALLGMAGTLTPLDQGIREWLAGWRLDAAIQQARNRKAVYLFGPSLPSDVQAMAAALQRRGMSQVVVLADDPDTMQSQLDGKVLEWTDSRIFSVLPELYVYASEDDQVADQAMEDLSQTEFTVHHGGVIDDAERFFRLVFQATGVPESYLSEEHWRQMFQALQSAAGLEQAA